MIIRSPGVATRLAAFGILVALSLPAQPLLTTIRDVLYKADGSRFNGYVQINWTSFEAGDTSNIATQFRAVRIVDGNLQVKLVPTTNADRPATYAVQYNSNGKVQFEETWAVPPSSQPLRVRDVRISSPPNLASGGGPIQESDVLGLTADLNARPTEGPGYATGRVLLSNSAGELEAVGGSLSDCVHVDGSSGPCGASTAAGFIDGETPSGLVDGANTNFGLAGQPDPLSSVALYRNGILQKQSQDFTISVSTIQFLSASTPQPGDTLLVSYRVAGTGSPLTSASIVETVCSSTGGNTSSTASTSLGACTIPALTLKPGDRVEIG